MINIQHQILQEINRFIDAEIVISPSMTCAKDLCKVIFLFRAKIEEFTCNFLKVLLENRVKQMTGLKVTKLPMSSGVARNNNNNSLFQVFN